MHAVGGLQRFVAKKSSKVFSLLPRMLSSDKGAGFGTWDGKISKRTGEEIDLLDVGVITKTRGPQPSNGDMPSASSAVKGRLNRPLQKQEKKVLSGPQLGALEATAEDLYDVLCDALSSSSFHNLFRGTSDASEAVDFVDCKLNADCSHATVRWKSPVIAQFAKVVYKKKGPAQAQKFSKNAIKYINKKLAGRESQFRSIVIRNMHFRRVPRIFFEPEDASMGLDRLGELKRSVPDMRQQVMREQDESDKSQEWEEEL